MMPGYQYMYIQDKYVVFAILLRLITCEKHDSHMKN